MCFIVCRSGASKIIFKCAILGCSAVDPNEYVDTEIRNLFSNQYIYITSLINSNFCISIIILLKTIGRDNRIGNGCTFARSAI